MSNAKLRSLGLSETEWATMISVLEAQKKPADRLPQERRDGAAQRFPIDAYGGLKLVLPDYRSTSHKVRMRNVSAGGVGFFHNAFVHCGTRCYVALRTTSGQGIAVAGEVTWCRFLSNSTHEIGVRCDEEIDLTQFLDAETLASTPPPAEAAAGDDAVWPSDAV